jgi:hypothetical protein
VLDSLGSRIKIVLEYNRNRSIKVYSELAFPGFEFLKVLNSINISVYAYLIVLNLLSIGEGLL